MVLYVEKKTFYTFFFVNYMLLFFVLLYCAFPMRFFVRCMFFFVIDKIYSWNYLESPKKTLTVEAWFKVTRLTLGHDFYELMLGNDLRFNEKYDLTDSRYVESRLSLSDSIIWNVQVWILVSLKGDFVKKCLNSFSNIFL